jgi:hypothetical protein
MPTISLTFSGVVPVSIALVSIEPSAVVSGFALSGSTFSATFSGSASSYVYSYTAHWGDGSTTPGSGVVAGDGARGVYCDQGDVENVFGVSNVAAWSNLDNTRSDADVMRIAAALVYAVSEIDDFFRGGPYAVPLVVNSGTTVATWAAKLAGIWLYDSRGQLDSIVDGGVVRSLSRYAGMKKSVYVEMGLYKIGYKRLDAARGDCVPSGPVVVVT